MRKVFDVASNLTDAKLEIRDFNIAFEEKTDGLYQLIKHLKILELEDAVGSMSFKCRNKLQL